WDAEFHCYAGRSAGDPWSAALYPWADRLDQPAVFLAAGGLWAADGDAGLGVAQSCTDPGACRAHRRAEHRETPPRSRADRDAAEPFADQGGRADGGAAIRGLVSEPRARGAVDVRVVRGPCRGDAICADP